MDHPILQESPSSQSFEAWHGIDDEPEAAPSVVQAEPETITVIDISDAVPPREFTIPRYIVHPSRANLLA